MFLLKKSEFGLVNSDGRHENTCAHFICLKHVTVDDGMNNVGFVVRGLGKSEFK